MDIQYLLWLQELRNATGGIFDEFFNALSKFAVDILPFLPFVIFWGVDKKWGYFFMTNQWLGELINGVIKLTVCAYRPWIRSELIEPAGDSKVAATGYSFPSGHTRTATANYGSVFVWQKDKRRWLSITCAILILLTGFSRNFLGVHTPQDVVVAFWESVILIYAVGIVTRKVNGNDKVLDILTVIGIVFVIASLVYIQKACGAFLGYLIGSYVDRHYIHFEIPAGAKELPILVCVGVALAFSWKEYFGPATFVLALGGHWGNFITRLIMLLFAMLVWPLVITRSCKK